MAIATIKTSLGNLNILANAQGLCKLSWHELADEFAGEGENIVVEAVKQLEKYASGQLTKFDLPISFVTGTNFQQKVWCELAKLPYGQTCSYAELAEKVNSHPRAIGSAVGKNPLPIIIPCHRVVGKNGAMTGFSGGDGISTKIKLLELEGVNL